MYQWPTRYFAWVDSDLETFNSWWPSPNLLRCTNLNYSPGAGIKWSHTHAIGMLVRTMPVFKSLSGFIVYFDFLFLFDFSPLSPCSKLANFTLLSSALSSAPKFSRTENPCWPDNQSDILPTWSDIPKWVVGHVKFWWNSPWQRSPGDGQSPCVSKSCTFWSFHSGSYFPPTT